MSSYTTQWGDEQIHIVSEMFKAGKSRDEIAAAVGRKKDAVARLLTKLGLTRNGLYWTTERNAMLRQMWRAGDPVQAIIDQLGGEIGEDAVKAQVKRLGMSTYRRAPRSPWTDQDDARLIQLREEGMTFSAIAREMSRGFNSVKDRYQELTQSPHPIPRLVDAEETKTDKRGRELVRVWLRAMANIGSAA